MARKETLKFYCDNCRTEGNPDWDNSDDHITHPLPLGWIHIDLKQDGGMLFDGDLCDKCLTALMNGLKKRYKEDGS